MYHPYFRGKQYELLTVRECAPLLQQAGFVPIIEPVKESLTGLERALAAVTQAGGEAVLVVNPSHGDHSDDATRIGSFLSDQLADMTGVSVGVLLTEQTTADDVTAICAKHPQRPVTLIHAGFTDAATLANRLEPGSIARHVFVDDSSGKLYRRRFREAERVLVRDGFQRQKNADYPPVEFFSDLHVTFEEEGVSGFGDFLVVGDEYMEAGGPAYAVAIHLTYIDPDKDEAMYIFHFVSDQKDTPTDPAGKFAVRVHGMDAVLTTIELSLRPHAPAERTAVWSATRKATGSLRVALHKPDLETREHSDLAVEA